MIKHGTPERIEPVQQDEQAPQGIDVTAAREAPSPTAQELLDEGTEWGSESH